MEIILALATKSSATSSAASAALGPPHATLLPLVRLLYEPVQLAIHIERDIRQATMDRPRSSVWSLASL